MDILILGGTRFVGRHLVEAALARGHQVTLFNRGKSNPDLYPELEKLVGDRDGALYALQGRKWDAVVDISAYLPRIAAQSAELLKTAVSRYLFISTISVYDDFSQPINEDSPLAQLEDPTTEAITGATYGGLKVLCEAEVARIFPGNHTIIRPGYIVGPYDYTNRFPYWVRRTAAPGPIAAAGSPDAPIQFVDGRDLADFTLHLLENDQNGIYNCTGPATPLSWAQYLAACLQHHNNDAEIIWLPEPFLTSQELPGNAFPMWSPAAHAELEKVDISRALNAGLTIRPLAATIADTYEWAKAVTDPQSVGLTPEQEKALLTTFGS